ncbi:hypothetical protein Kpho02_65440 [Kitasatospora phosalacinea]|uniref:Uncharacterized protein n=1 Tax=Kitasatospora phosalacinea TaxID=2065 RepID=A0A9W6QET8_9ACTN|nr:hypothetical protein [Kitasatospora phosalacinea]GLW74246.1 hypothetical protein Kpho02_65440 [Kitasatospora phosalacinea]
MTATARTARRTTLLGAGTLLLAGVGVGAAAASPHDVPPPVSVATTGTFSFHPCASGTPAADSCLTDHVTGALPGLGSVSGVFEVHIATSAAAADGCAPIDKHGAFTVPGRGTVEVRATGVYCSAHATAAYEYRVTGGTGELTGAGGRGQWLVPAPASFADGNGSGTEYFYGTLHG